MLLDVLKKSQQGTDLGFLMDESQEDDDGVQSEDESHEDDGVQPEDESDAIVDVPVLPHRRSLKLMKDICTRWNSTFYMLQLCVLLQKHITNVLAESKYAHLVPSADKWLAAEKLHVFAVEAVSNCHRLSAGRKVPYFRRCFKVYYNSCGWTPRNNTASALAIRDPLEQSSKRCARGQGLYIAGHEAALGSY